MQLITIATFSTTTKMMKAIFGKNLFKFHLCNQTAANQMGESDEFYIHLCETCVLHSLV